MSKSKYFVVIVTRFFYLNSNSINIYVQDTRVLPSKKKFIVNKIIFEAFRLFIRELLINFNKSKSHSIVIEIFWIVKSNISIFEQESKFEFKNWNYIITKIKFIKIDSKNNIYLDIEYDIILIDRFWLTNFLFNIKILKMISFLKIRGMRNF